jgi:tRNA (guanine-N7-)-methyltransferase
MGQKKLIRFEAIRSFNNVLEYPENVEGKWSEMFNNDHPITLELACGKGEYTVGLARMYAEQNFIGIDVKGNRIWRGAKTAIDENLNNVRFLRTQIDRIDEYFSTNEVADIWITFPDPQLQLSRFTNRLTHPKFLRKYQRFLKETGTIRLKTDSPDLYQFTKKVIEFYGLELLADHDDVYSVANRIKELDIKTYYESLDIAQSNKVHYLQFRLNKEFPESTEEELKNLFRETHD